MSELAEAKYEARGYLGKEQYGPTWTIRIEGHDLKEFRRVLAILAMAKRKP